MERKWSDPTLLKTLKNPSKESYEVKVKAPEFTFMGGKNKPDFASIYLVMYPGKYVVELKSLKIYLQQFREKIFSYERIINVLYNDLMSVYEPERLRITVDFTPRGGLSSVLTIDSDWLSRGGEDKFKSWSEKPW